MSFLGKIVQNIYNTPLMPLFTKLYTNIGPKNEIMIDLDVNNSKLLIDPQKPGERALLFREHTEPKIFSIAMTILCEKDVFVDVGAYIGNYSIPAASIVGERGQVIAFEPDRRNFKKLERNAKINDLNNIDIINKAVSDSNCEVPFNSKNNTMSRISSGGDFVRTTTLNDSICSDDIKLMKIDVEGHEREVLEGANHILERTNNLIVEVHQNLGVSKENILSILRKYNFHVKVLPRKGMNESYLVAGRDKSVG